MLHVLSSLGMKSVMLNAIKNLYKVTKVFLKNVVSTKGIRQGAFFIIFINDLFGYLRDSFTPNKIFVGQYIVYCMQMVHLF